MSIETRPHDFQPHAGLSSPYTHFSPGHSDQGPPDHAANPGHFQGHVKFEPDSARPGAYAEYIAQQAAPRTYPQPQQHPQHQPAQQANSQQNQHPVAPPTPTSQNQSSGQPPHSAAMAQTSPTAAIPPASTPNGHAQQRHSQHFNSDPRFSSDGAIPASSPTYPPHPQYSPYPPQHEMPQYPGPGPMYAPRHDWPGHYGPPPTMYMQGTAGGPGAGMVAPQGHPMSTVYSFVPIPGAQQHKRPRRRYEEIERMYKCGWQGCEKAYGTLNHLNAHVTMQAHGQKRTPEEFKDIRKEWKARKKEEEQSRKQDEERQRAEGRPVDGTPTQPQGPYPPQHMIAPIAGGPQLPPIGYMPAPGSAPVGYAAAPPPDGQPYPPQGAVYPNGYPPSPYAQPGPQMYQQHPEQQQQQQQPQQQQQQAYPQQQ